eukprot:1754350-Rhodomonas_salina.5
MKRDLSCAATCWRRSESSPQSAPGLGNRGQTPTVALRRPQAAQNNHHKPRLSNPQRAQPSSATSTLAASSRCPGSTSRARAPCRSACADWRDR